MGYILRRLNILQVSTSDGGGGAEGSAWNLFQAFRARRCNSWLAVGYKYSDDPNVLLIPNGAYRNFWVRFWQKVISRVEKFDGKVRGAWRMHRLLSWLAEPEREMARFIGVEDFDFPGSRYLLDLLPERPHLVHCHNLHGGYFDLRILPRLSHQIPVILDLRDAWLLGGHCAHSFDCERWKYGCGHCPDLTIYPAIRRDSTVFNWQRKSDIYSKSRFYITTPSQWLMNKVKQSMLHGVEYRVIPNAVDLSIFHPGDQSSARTSLGLPTDSKIVLFAANRIRGNPFKDYETMETAIQRVVSQNQNTKLIFVCIGASKKEQNLSQSWTQFVAFERDPKRMAQYYQSADVYIHAAKAENFSKAVIEALACSTPVVATAVGGIPEQVEDGVTGFLVPLGDAETMAARIEQLLSDVDLRYKFSQAAVETARRRFDLNRQVDDYLGWYREILQQRPKQAEPCRRKNSWLKRIT